MNSFLEESVNANFNHGGKILHKTKAQKKACYDKNNARNRDLFSRNRVTGALVSSSEIEDTQSAIDEDSLITAADLTNKKKV